MNHTVVQRYQKRLSALAQEVRAGVDWISCSLPADAPYRWEWANECIDCLIDISKQGHAIGDSGHMGYRGVQVGGSFVGNREDSSYCQLAGRFADVYLDRIARADLHISRIDLAVTVQFRLMPRQLGAVAYGVALEADENLSSSRRRRLWYMSGNDGGYTLYIGAPSSDQRGRLYNKEVQSATPEYARSWRYETVYRNTRAMAAFEELLETKGDERAARCGDLVGLWYQNRGVFCPWFTTTHSPIRPLQAENPSDAAKKIKWLQTQVAPALRWLIEHNYRDEALTALGLAE